MLLGVGNGVDLKSDALIATRPDTHHAVLVRLTLTGRPNARVGLNLQKTFQKFAKKSTQDPERSYPHAEDEPP